MTSSNSNVHSRGDFSHVDSQPKNGKFASNSQNATREEQEIRNKIYRVKKVIFETITTAKKNIRTEADRIEGELRALRVRSSKPNLPLIKESANKKTATTKQQMRKEKLQAALQKNYAYLNLIEQRKTNVANELQKRFATAVQKGMHELAVLECDIILNLLALLDKKNIEKIKGAWETEFPGVTRLIAAVFASYQTPS